MYGAIETNRYSYYLYVKVVIIFFSYLVLLSMKAIAIFFLFLGILLIIQGYYSNKSVCEKNKVVVKYVPRSFYEEQMNPEESLQTFYKSMFEDIILL